jgi:hypothetical protein
MTGHPVQFSKSDRMRPFQKARIKVYHLQFGVSTKSYRLFEKRGKLPILSNFTEFHESDFIPPKRSFFLSGGRKVFRFPFSSIYRKKEKGSPKRA